MELTIEDIIKLPESERWEKFEKLAWYNCKGVGTTLTSPIYKLASTVCVTSIIGVLSAYFSNMVWAEWKSATADAQHFQDMIEETCNTQIDTALLSVWRTVSKSTNARCRVYQLGLAEATHAANDAAHDVTMWLWSKLELGTLLSGAAGTAGSLIKTDDTGWSMQLNTLLNRLLNLSYHANDIICKLAGVLERIVNVKNSAAACSYEDNPGYKLKY